MDKSYLEYPKRRYGQDHAFYEWRMSTERPKLSWDNGVKVAVTFITPLEFFPLNPSGTPFKHSGAMVTPYPDLRHFTVRDYGNRVGVFRILEALDDAGVKATFAVNGEIAKRFPPLITAIKDAGHEIAAHGLSTDHIHHEGLSYEEEQTLVNQTIDCFNDIARGWPGPKERDGERLIRGWLSPARNQSGRTLGCLLDEDIDYCLDWEMDQVPVQMKTFCGPIMGIPLSYELSDFTLLHTRRQTEESWLKQIQNAISLLSEEHERFGPQMLGLTLTPYVIGQPFRIWALRTLLTHIKKTDGIEVFRARDIADQAWKQL